MRIVAFADSLSMPRIVKNDIVLWEETWPYLLSKDLLKKGIQNEVINSGQRARTAASLIGGDFENNITFIRPDIIIIQIGVVDCTPRIISKKEKYLFNQRWFPVTLRDKLIQYRKNNKRKITGKKPLKKVYTKPEQFESYLNQFEDRLQNQIEKKVSVIVIPIIAHLEIKSKDSPKFTQNLERYNAILKTYCKSHGRTWIELENRFYTDSTLYCSDGYHLNPSGNKELSEILLKSVLAYHDKEFLKSSN